MEIVFESTGNIEYFEEEELIEQEPVQIDQEHLYAPGQADPTRSDSNSEEIIEEKEEEKEEIEEVKEEIEEEEVLKDGESKQQSDVVDVLIPFGNDIYVYDGFEPVNSVSYNNIIDTPLNEYNVSESLQLLIFLSIFIGGFIFLVRRAVLKWS